MSCFGGGKNKKKVGGNAFSEPIMRQAHNLGDVTQAKTNQVDMGETQKRSKDFKNGSMAIQRIGKTEYITLAIQQQMKANQMVDITPARFNENISTK